MVRNMGIYTLLCWPCYWRGTYHHVNQVGCSHGEVWLSPGRGLMLSLRDLVGTDIGVEFQSQDVSCC